MMHLARMRKANFYTAMTTIYRDHRKELSASDQGIINYFLFFNPQVNYLLPCEWNFRYMMCHWGGPVNHCQAAFHDGIKLLHGHSKTFEDAKSKSPPFRLVQRILMDFNVNRKNREEVNNIITTITRVLTTGIYGELKYPTVSKHGCAPAALYTSQLKRWIT